MIKRWMYLMVLIILMVGCTQADNTDKSVRNHGIIFNSEKTRAAIVNTTDTSLLSIEYLLTNESDESFEPFYLNFIFHDKTLIDYLEMDEHSPFRRMGGADNMISLGPGETYAGGLSLEISQELVEDQEKNRWASNHNNVVEIQLLSLDDDRILSSYWIHHINVEFIPH